ncbi:MAG TPA: hypothetical protein VIL30_26895 [Ramlibacter sp.]|jgi:hypothetical protein
MANDHPPCQEALGTAAGGMTRLDGMDTTAADAQRQQRLADTALALQPELLRAISLARRSYDMAMAAHRAARSDASLQALNAAGDVVNAVQGCLYTVSHAVRGMGTGPVIACGDHRPGADTGTAPCGGPGPDTACGVDRAAVQPAAPEATNTGDFKCMRCGWIGEADRRAPKCGNCDPDRHRPAEVSAPEGKGRG